MPQTMTIAGVAVTEDTYDQLANTVMMPDLPIIYGDGKQEVPADNLLGWLAKELGLDGDHLTPAQAEGLAVFINFFTL